MRLESMPKLGICNRCDFVACWIAMGVLDHEYDCLPDQKDYLTTEDYCITQPSPSDGHRNNSPAYSTSSRPRAVKISANKTHHTRMNTSISKLTAAFNGQPKPTPKTNQPKPSPAHHNQ